MKYLKRFLLIIISSIVFFLLYLEFGGRFIINDTDKRLITYEIRSSEKIPANFSNFYNTVYPNSLSGNSWNFILTALMNSDSQRKECPCNQMAYRIFPALEIKNEQLTDQFLLARYIEHHYSQQDCLEFNFSHFDFLENRKGLQKVSKSLFNKETKDLTPIEMAEILALYEAPHRNNRHRNPKKAKARAGHFLNLYEKNVNK
ncbi:transglycosylase domain-containing protein [Chryseobacterium gwangjuense]|uniref:transglycosylase domain-containing protein n=1 Tax=Chryseobacterium gwangjuense TaxID=1069980 RepID=UPI001E3ED9B7|nr:transglycosylase domain-containing protein [Chryseobacterium gwangjuense]MCE3075878.1 transglycosylase domain-containing protein [Chryseobacterium gwangjuense]